MPFHSVGLEGGAALPGHHLHLSTDTNGFLLWGTVKNKVYEINPHTVNKLKDCISDTFTEREGDTNLCCNVCQSFLV